MTSIDLGPAPKVVGRLADSYFLGFTTAAPYNYEFTVHAGGPIAVKIDGLTTNIFEFSLDQGRAVSFFTHGGLSDHRPDRASLAYVRCDIGAHGVGGGLSTTEYGYFSPVSVELH